MTVIHRATHIVITYGVFIQTQADADMWDEYWHKCRLYAEEEFSTVQKTRQQRGQSNPRRIIHQTAVGKMGELMACDYLRGLGYECTDPDFQVYKARQKSWDSDMYLTLTHRHKVACKAQDEESARRFGQSWIFQKGGHGFGHTDPVIQKGESLSVFVSLNLKEKTAEVRGPFRMCDLRPLFKPPRIERLRFSKVALYWEDMKDVPVYNGVVARPDAPKMSSEDRSERPAKKRKTDEVEVVEDLVQTVSTPHVIYVVDRSGSMHQFGEEGYGSVQAAIANLPADRGEDCLLSVFTFDNKHEEVVKGVKAAGYVLPKHQMEPRGMTALRDSVRNALEYAGTLPHKVFLVVFTDGEDNVSKTSSETLKKMIKSSNVDISWLAAGEAEVCAATDLGIDGKDVLKVGARGSNMMTAMRFSSQKSDAGFTEMQRSISIKE